MKRMLLRRIWIIGALAGVIVIAGAVRTAATAGHGQVHLVVASSSGSVAERQVERHAEAQPTAEAGNVVAEPEAVDNEAAENEAAQEANEPAEEANEPAEEANEPAENENEQAPPTPAAPAPTAPPAPAASTSQTFSLIGGTVMVTCTGNAITLNSATPNSGFSIDQEENEDGQVEVRFRSDSHESRLQVACHNGTVVLEELREDKS